MRNIYILPTDKPSRLHTYKGVLNLAAAEFVAPTIVKNNLINLNIYITNDVEIKEGDFFLHPDNTVERASRNLDGRGVKKIILTTDPSLDSVQAIDDEFLEWFVMNPICEKIEIKTRYLHSYKTGETFISFSKTPEFSSRNMQCIKIEPRYEIIIPQEESKQENCCTPAGQIKRYVDCVGCDRKPKQMSKQTAVEWLVEKLILDELIDAKNGHEFLHLQSKAKEMEKEQQEMAFNEALDQYSNRSFEQYYNETYKKEEK
jgi:hypothetical protein